eukprot:TRINITY_DN9755_c0_g1_i2.p1 TRINITY_DN9755_c0_g1~~TRINITY_DN9755_c0_g1_i2.p1  ORF type:complete len:281 (-),score=55.99 TRINITY_DN9755_c0_g1_i2:207-1049(-)
MAASTVRSLFRSIGSRSNLLKRSLYQFHSPRFFSACTDPPLEVMEVYVGSEGLLRKGNSMKPWLFIDTSTVDPQTSRTIAEKVSTCTLSRTCSWKSPVMLDAPVSGGVPAAEARKLTFMVGGLEKGFLAAKPLFLIMGKDAVHCGISGNGSAAKICNNLAMAVSMAGTSEAYALGQQLGIDAPTLTKILNCSSGRSWCSDTYNPIPGVMEGVPSSNNYDGGFSCNLMKKDLELALAATKGRMLMPLGSKVYEMYSSLCNNEKGRKDFSSIFLYYYSRSEK